MATTEAEKARSRRYRLNNKDKISAYMKGYAKRNRDKINARRREHKKQNPKDPTAKRKETLKYKYGLTIEEYKAIFWEQQGLCKICKADVPGGTGYWHTDHDHTTGKIRGILCHSCNTALGHVHDSIEILQTMIDYLKEASIGDAVLQ